MIRHVAAVAMAVCLSPAWLHAQTVKLTVTAPSADVHKFASIGSPIIGRAPRGTVLEVARELGSWVRISWPGGEDGFAFMHVSRGTITRTTTPEVGRNAAAAPAAQRPGSAGPRGQTPRTGPATQPARPAPAQQTRPVYVTPATHVVGIGGRLGDSTMGFGASARAWRQNHLGFQMAVSRSSLTSAIGPERLTSLDLEPSVLWSLRDHVGDYFWLRPYVGSGATLRRQSLSLGNPSLTDSTTDAAWGYQAFGGGEFTFSGLPRFAVSTDLGYRWSRMPVDGFDLGGFGLSVSGHWYVK
jgi:hypothetical protein